MIDLVRRSYDMELMDDLNSSGEIIAQTLKELEIINKWLGGNQVTIQGLDNLIRDRERTRPLRIIDMGCGGGDMLVRVNKWASLRNIPVDLTGIDANPHILEYARENTRGTGITFLEKNILDEEEIPDCDIMLATLFLHHFTKEELITILKNWVLKTSTGIVVNDIHRHWLAYYSIALLTRTFSKSEMVLNDGPLSVRRAFKRSELRDIVESADIRRYRLTWAWAFRWSLIIHSNSSDKNGYESI